jgi:tetratricopeptide (TPR) repeat protein
VLEVRWRISQKAQNWDACLELGRVLTELAPHWAMSWVLQAQSYYYQQRPQAAYDTLRPKADAFPQSYEVAYDLACYSSLLGHMEEAVAWLEKAAALGDASRVQRMAETDPDFIPLWEYLGKRGLWA